MFFIFPDFKSVFGLGFGLNVFFLGYFRPIGEALALVTMPFMMAGLCAMLGYTVLTVMKFPQSYAKHLVAEYSGYAGMIFGCALGLILFVGGYLEIFAYKTGSHPIVWWANVVIWCPIVAVIYAGLRAAMFHSEVNSLSD